MNKEKGQYTVDEHYVPKMILRKHAINPTSPKKEQKTFFLDKLNLPYGTKRIDEIPCFEKDFYETFNKDGKYVYRNEIEDSYSKREEKWQKLLKKVENEEKLSKEEIDNLYGLVAQQFLRTKKTHERLEELILRDNPNSIYEIDFTLKSFINICTAYKKGDFGNNGVKKETQLDCIKEEFKKLNIHILKSNIPFILSLDYPVIPLCMIEKDANNDTLTPIIFPFSAHLSIVLTHSKFDSFYLNVSNSNAKIINKIIFESGENLYIASEPFEELTDI